MNKKDEKKISNLDQILIEEVGQCGRFQLRVIALCALVALFTGFDGNLYIFTFAKVRTRCFVPECETSSPLADFSASWILDAIPVDGDFMDNCHRFTTISDAASNNCSTKHFNRNSTEECEKYVYEHTNSAIFEFNLACDDWRPNLAGSVLTFGHMLALPFGGFVADRWGRRVALALSAFNMAWLGCMLYFADTYFSYVIIGFIKSVIGASCYDNAYILAVEYVGPKKRVSVGAALSSFAACGRILMGVMTWSEPYWRHLILLVYGPSMITLLYFWMAPESIRWLMSKNRHEEAMVILEKAAEINGNVLSEGTLRRFHHVKDLEAKGIKEYQPWLVCLVFKNKAVLLSCLVSSVWWLTTIFVYLGLTISSVSISGNRFLNYSLVAAIAIPGYWVAVLLLEKIGRKPLLIGTFWICGACQLAYIIIPKSSYWPTLIMFLASKLTTSVAMSTISVYTAELYPTRYRASLYAFSGTFGTLGGAMAPIILSLAATTWNHLAFAVFGGMAFLSGSLVFLTPETFGSTLPDTMEEVTRLGEVQHQEVARASKVLQPLI